MQNFAKCAAFLGIVLASGALVAARGDEPPASAIPDAEIQAAEIHATERACNCPQVGVPMLSRIPYISRLFKNAGVAHAAGCEAGQCPTASHCQKTPCADQLERIGIDFEICPDCPDSQVFQGHVMRFGPIELAICADEENCCCRGKECACLTCACPAGVCVAGHCSPQASAVSHAAACCAQKEAAEHAQHTAACKCEGRDELWEHLVEMAAAKGAAEAALEAREEQSELLDALVEMATKGAALEAKLEAQAEHHKFMERMVELASENAQLKARAELAEAKAEMLRETLPIAIEKVLLARRVTELEQLLASGDEGVRTANKPSRKKAQ